MNTTNGALFPLSWLLVACVVAVTLLSGPARASAQAPDVVLVVDLNLAPGPNPAVVRLAGELEKLAPGTRVEIVHHPELTEALLERRAPRAVVLSPQGDPWWLYPPEELSRLGALVRGLDVPVLGVCGGHQFLAIAYGGQVAPIKDKPQGPSYEGMTREKGTTQVVVLEADALLEGFAPGTTLRVHEYHTEEVKRLPEGFVWLVKGSFSPYQAFRHPTKPIFGVQFHPESRPEKLPDGVVLLRNFLKMALGSAR